jgi:hypothetical protein
MAWPGAQVLKKNGLDLNFGVAIIFYAVEESK